jgi:hypothetical protein
MIRRIINAMTDQEVAEVLQAIKDRMVSKLLSTPPPGIELNDAEKDCLKWRDDTRYAINGCMGKIGAIRSLRNRYNLTLMAAKKVVDDWCAGQEY